MMFCLASYARATRPAYWMMQKGILFYRIPCNNHNICWYQNNLNPSEQKKGKYGTKDFSRSATNSLENETPGKVFKFHHSTEVMKIDDPPLTFVSHWKNSRAPSFKRGKRKRFSFASESNLTTSIALLILLFGSNIRGVPEKDGF